MDNHEQVPPSVDVPDDIPVLTPQPKPYGVTPAPSNRRRWWPVFLAGTLTGAAVASAVWGIITAAPSSEPAPAVSTFTLKGKMTQHGICGSGGYNDITEGASVTVYNAAGSVIGNGQLSNKTFLPSGQYGCTFDIAVPDVPGGEKFYQVEVTHRGKVTFPADKAKAGEVSLSLGQ